MSNTATKRLQKEFKSMQTAPPPGVQLDPETAGANLKKWRVFVDGAEGTLYSGERFILELTFSDRYPFDSPSVKFIGAHIPIHPHIYSNGHICLNILTTDWTPALSVNSICLSILSMLSSCPVKKRPDDDRQYVPFAPSDPKKSSWLFDDDTV